MHTHARAKAAWKRCAKQTPEDGLALNIHSTFWALGPRALVMAI